MSERSISVAEWARTTKPKQGCRGCRACAAPSEARIAMKLIASMRRKGESIATGPQVREFINARFRLDLSLDIVRRHFIVCLKTPWGVNPPTE